MVIQYGGKMTGSKSVPSGHEKNLAGKKIGPTSAAILPPKRSPANIQATNWAVTLAITSALAEDHPGLKLGRDFLFCKACQKCVLRVTMTKRLKPSHQCLN
jgi:hypothetical protein